MSPEPVADVDQSDSPSSVNPDIGFDVDVVVLGGCGRVGLPLAVVLAESGLRTSVLDLDARAVAAVTAGRMPFAEEGAQPVLTRVVSSGTLTATTDDAVLARAATVIIAVGTPVGSDARPDTTALDRAMASCRDHLRDSQLIVLRSTVFPGTTARLEKTLAGAGREVEVVYCPERIAEGRAMAELRELPQIIGSRTGSARERAVRLVEALGVEPVHLTPEEAEFAKLATNAWRYLTFAVANELYMIADRNGLDFSRIRDGLRHGYPRAAGLPSAGLSAGPCLPKDTAQLLGFAGPSFSLGAAALRVNQGLPSYLVERTAEQHDLEGAVVGLLGMSFKKDSDDVRDSLAHSVRDEFVRRGAVVHCTDPHVREDPELRPLDDVLAVADLIVVTAPHTEYHGLRARVPVVDVWGIVEPPA